VDVFDLDRTLVDDYASFARSFTQIRARDIQDQVDVIYASGRFWPEPLITINPHYERGAPVEALLGQFLDVVVAEQPGGLGLGFVPEN
jgi:hydroxymethylpyrimidine pyrophosphatase-like HAD family hydrolase